MRWIEKKVLNYSLTYVDCSIYETNQGGYIETVSVFEDLRIRLKFTPVILSQDNRDDHIRIHCRSEGEIALINKYNELKYNGLYQSSKVEIETHNQLLTDFIFSGSFAMTSENSVLIGVFDVKSPQKSTSWGVDMDLHFNALETRKGKWKSLVSSIDAQ